MPEISLNGPAGRLEARYQPGKDKRAHAALLLHPHPQHGGTMNNKVVYTLFRAFSRSGFAALRFNFRGVGKSQGAWGGGAGELADAAAALDWLQAANPEAESCWIGGFSFGAWIAMQLLARRPEIKGFIVAAPPVNLADFGTLPRLPASGLIVQGDQDQIVPPAGVKALAEKLQTQRDIIVTYRVIEGADHFFVDRLEQLGGIAESYIASNRHRQPAKAV
ncbi:MAG TPA: alpha/beta hydrolase [Stellaceae bacterium]|nr:alpha/beta hydrolase [Stellaceae bacterium]